MYPLQHILTLLDMLRKIIKGILPSTGKAFLHWLPKELQPFINKYMNTYCSTHTPTGDHQEELG